MKDTLPPSRRCSQALSLAAALATTLSLLSTPTLAADDKVDDAKTTIKQDAKEVGHAVAQDSREAGHAIAQDSKKVGDAVAHSAKAVGSTAKQDSKKVGAAVTPSKTDDPK